MIQIEHRHTAGLGRHVRITLSEAELDALAAAVQVAYDDPASTPDEYVVAASELWDAFVPADPGNHVDADRPPGTSGSWGEQ